MVFMLNGKESYLDQPMNIKDFIIAKGLDPNTVIVEYNHEILKIAEWSNFTLKENDNLEILRFVGGG